MISLIIQSIMFVKFQIKRVYAIKSNFIKENEPYYLFYLQPLTCDIYLYTHLVFRDSKYCRMFV